MTLVMKAPCLMDGASYGLDIPCFAMELEHDIAMLEAEANRDELVPWCPQYADGLVGVACCHNVEEDEDDDDDDVAPRDQDMGEASGADSEDASDDASDAEVARAVMANALLVAQCGKPMQAGAWRGCCKSPLCDREDRHRGLCNHRATIVGPAAIAASSKAQQDKDDGDDDEEEQQQQQQQELATAGKHAAAAFDSPQDSSMEAHTGAEEQQVSSGGHSHTCQAGLEVFLSHDEREVVSTLQTGDANQQQPLQQQQSVASTQLLSALSHLTPSSSPAGAPPAPDSSLPHTEELGRDLLWCGSSSSQFVADEQLIMLPAAYQPRVKDLAAPGDGLLDGLEEQGRRGVLCAAVDGASDATQPLSVQAVGIGSPSSHCSSMTLDKLGQQSCSSSSPSTPCYTSASAIAAAVFGGAFGATLVADRSGVVVTSTKPMAVHLVAQPLAASSDSSHAAMAAAAAEAMAAAEAAAASAAAAVTGVVSASAVAAAVLEAAAPTVAAAAAAAAMGSSSGSSSGAPVVSQRPPRVKSRLSHSMVKAAAAAGLDVSGSPKSKKRPCSRFATNPSDRHSCSQCGATSTPVWRAGPAGPKTLCNACGVRWLKNSKRK